MDEWLSLHVANKRYYFASCLLRSETFVPMFNAELKLDCHSTATSLLRLLTQRKRRIVFQEETSYDGFLQHRLWLACSTKNIQAAVLIFSTPGRFYNVFAKRMETQLESNLLEAILLEVPIKDVARVFDSAINLPRLFDGWTRYQCLFSLECMDAALWPKLLAIVALSLGETVEEVAGDAPRPLCMMRWGRALIVVSASSPVDETMPDVNWRLVERVDGFFE